MISYWDERNGGHLERPVKNASVKLETSNECFFNCYDINFQEMQYFLVFLVSVINHYHINRLHLFWNSFQWFSLEISSIFFFSCPRHCDQGFIVVIVYYFHIWNKKEHNIIICRVINSHMVTMYIETLYG